MLWPRGRDRDAHPFEGTDSSGDQSGPTRVRAEKDGEGRGEDDAQRAGGVGHAGGGGFAEWGICEGRDDRLHGGEFGGSGDREAGGGERKGADGDGAGHARARAGQCVGDWGLRASDQCEGWKAVPHDGAVCGKAGEAMRGEYFEGAEGKRSR